MGCLARALAACAPPVAPRGPAHGSPGPAPTAKAPEEPHPLANPEAQAPPSFERAEPAEVEALLSRIEQAASGHFETHPYSQIWIAVEREALAHNAAALDDRLAGRDLCAVVKGDAYGHGLEIAARAFAPHAEAFCLSENAEARRIRTLGLRERVIRIRLASVREMMASLEAGHDVEEFVGSLEMARAFDAAVAELADERGEPITLAIHVVLDSTGMGRNGFPLGRQRQRTLERLAEVAALPHLRIVGITAHLPGADAVDFGPTLDKARAFLTDAAEVHAVVAKEGHAPQWHLSNSAASARLPEAIHAKLHMDRIGGTLYGMQTYLGEDMTPWREAMTVVGHVAAVHRRNEGDTVGYSSTARVPHDDDSLANIGVGWLNLPRQLSNRGFVLDGRGEPHPIVGKVSMNTIVVASGAEAGLDAGDPVLLLSPLGPTIEDTAQRIDQPPSYVTIAIAKPNAARFAY